MGKVLGSILLIAAAIAVNVIPGVGQVLSAGLISGITAAGIGAGLSLGASLLGLGPSGPKPDTTETSIKTSRPPRVSAYGRSRLYGAYVLYETAENGTAVDVYAVHDGEMDGLETRYLADEVVTLTGAFVNEGTDERYKDSAVGYYNTTGATPGTAISAITSLLPGIWTSNHRGDGVVLLALTAKAVKAKKFQDTYPQSGVPTPSIVARWQKCPPLTGSPWVESGWSWTENPVRHLLHYKMVREGPKSSLPKSNAGYAADIQAKRQAWFALRVAPTLSMWQAAAAVCDASRSLKAGGSEARYRSCVAHKHTDEHKGPVGAILATFDGWLATRSDGAYALYAGQYTTPTVSITPAEILSYTWEGGGADDDEAVNEVLTTYVSADHDYNAVDADPWRNESDISARGQVLSATIDLQIPSHAQARYLAKRYAIRKAAIDRGTVTTNIAGRIARGQRYINLLLQEAGATFYNGPVEITALTRNIRGGVTFSWVAADPNIDAWNPATEEGTAPAVGDRIISTGLTLPTISSMTTLAGTDGTRLQIVGGAAVLPRDDISWFARWRVAGATEWGPEEEYPDTDSSLATVTLRTNFVPADEEIEAQIQYQVGDGRFSGWSATSSTDTDTSGVPPGPAVIQSVTDQTGGVARVTWRNPSSSNFSYARVYRGTTNVFGSSVQVGGNQLGGLGALDTYDDNPGAGVFYYWVRSFNAAGTAGTVSGPLSVTVT